MQELEEVISAPLSRWSRGVATRVGIARRHVPYWLGQTFVAAFRKLPIVPIVDLLVQISMDSLELISLAA